MKKIKAFFAVICFFIILVLIYQSLNTILHPDKNLLVNLISYIGPIPALAVFVRNNSSFVKRQYYKYILMRKPISAIFSSKIYTKEIIDCQKLRQLSEDVFNEKKYSVEKRMIVNDHQVSITVSTEKIPSINLMLTIEVDNIFVSLGNPLHVNRKTVLQEIKDFNAIINKMSLKLRSDKVTYDLRMSYADNKNPYIEYYLNMGNDNIETLNVKFKNKITMDKNFIRLNSGDSTEFIETIEKTITNLL